MSRLRPLLVAVLAAAAVCAFSGPAAAYDITLLEAPDGHVHLRWTQPDACPGSYVDWIEVSKTDRTGTDGHFFREDVVDSAVWFSAAESTGEWLSSTQIEPGLYWVHLRVLCEITGRETWSNPIQLTVGGGEDLAPKISGRIQACCEMLTFKLKLCDPDGHFSFGVDFYVKEKLGRRARLTKKVFNEQLDDGCQPFTWSQPMKLVGNGTYRVSVYAVVSHDTSNTVARTFR